MLNIRFASTNPEPAMMRSRLVIAFLATFLSLWMPAGVAAQTGDVAPTATGSNRPFEILDNSFLVEEALNQPTNVFQNIMTFQVDTDAQRALQFTQEWPVGGPLHQLSYSVLVGLSRGQPKEFEQLDVNYRLQLLTESAKQPAFSPRVTLSVRNRSSHRFGGAVNLPFSKQFGNSYVHANAGMEWERAGAPVASDLLSPWVAASFIYRVLPMLHLMFEGGVTSLEVASTQGGGPGTLRVAERFISPGARLGFNLGSHQLVLGAALPFTHTEQEWSNALFTYVSYELPFGPTQ
jgi:hypothetical protein